MKTFLARQSLMDINNNVIGYELLFRNSQENTAVFQDNYYATMKVMKDLIINFGIDEITNQKRFFINFDGDLIKEGAPDLFRADGLVIELLETTLSDPNLIEDLKKYRQKGYLIALDDFQFSSKKIDLIRQADIIKLDFVAFSHYELTQIVKQLEAFNVILLAEKVETQEDFEFARELGCTMFQGYYFQRPTIFESNETLTIPTVYYELMDELNQSDVSFDRISDIVQKDSSLTLTLLKLLNSAAYYSNSKITSIKNALIRLGVKNSRKLLLINMLKSSTPEGTPHELINISIRRGYQAEQLATYYSLGHRKNELFMLGLLSLINIIMKKHMKNILYDVPLEDDVLEALLGTDNNLSSILDLIVLYELGDMDTVTQLLATQKIDASDFNKIYIDSVKWADSIWK